MKTWQKAAFIGFLTGGTLLVLYLIASKRRSQETSFHEEFLQSFRRLEGQ